MTGFTMRVRLASIGGSLGAAAGVLLFGTSTTRLLLFSTAGFLIGGGLGFFLGSRVRTEAAIARVERINRVNAVFLVMTGWLLVALGVVALVVGGWSVKIALITLAFLIAALLVTFHKRTREGPDLERFRNSSRKEDQA